MNYALGRTATDNACQFLDVAQIVINNFYMDDYLKSSPTVEEATRKLKDLVKLLSLGGFKLTKFVSNVHTNPLQLETDPTKPTEVKQIQTPKNRHFGIKVKRQYRHPCSQPWHEPCS